MTRRDEILRVAADLFAERGFHGVSVDELGASVGVSGPALYHHFASKESMLAEMLVDISEALLAEARRRVQQATDAGEALAALVDWHVTFALDHPSLITVQTRDLAHVPSDEARSVRRLQRQYVELWVDVACDSLGAQDRAAMRAAVHAVFGMLNSTPHSARLGRQAMAALLHRMALAALARA